MQKRKVKNKYGDKKREDGDKIERIYRKGKIGKFNDGKLNNEIIVIASYYYAAIMVLL